MDYGDIIYDKSNNESFKNKIESIQYKTYVAITRPIQGTSRERLHQEMELEPLCDRCRFRKLTCFVRLYKGLFQQYLIKSLRSNCAPNY